MWILTVLSCGEYCQTMQIGTVSGLWLRGRSWIFKIHIGGTLCFRKSYSCSNKLDVQETNGCFSQFNRIWNYLFGRWIVIRRASWSRIVGFDCFCFGKHDSDYRERTGWSVFIDRSQKSQGKTNALNNIDCVPTNVQSSHQEALLYVVCLWGQWSSDQDYY